MKLYPHQEKAVERLKNGSVLVGGVGSGKSLTALYYWHTKICGGSFQPYTPRKEKVPLYIITTARKRDTHDWEEELTPFLPGKRETIVVDSWNNIGKYIGVERAFFIFDEQRLVSYGSWSKAFIKITRRNKWILLSATPGDTWMDYLSLFIAHGFVRTKTEFQSKYCVFSRFSKYPKIERYVGEQELSRFRSKILVIMKDQRQTKRHYKKIFVEFDRDLYNFVTKYRKNPYNLDVETHQPLPCMDMGEVCRVLRRIVGYNENKLVTLWNIFNEFNKVIIFYNYDYELDMLRKWCEYEKITYAEWNGHKHELVPSGKEWCYLCQYTAAGEGWNCNDTNCTVFFSQNYSYKLMEQSSGRIDRMNTKFTDLYYFTLMTNSGIDKQISDAINRKKNFQEKDFVI
jgi:hypothetical protein